MSNEKYNRITSPVSSQKKSTTKTMKEATFTYQEQRNQGTAVVNPPKDGTPNRNLFKKTTPTNYANNPSANIATNKKDSSAVKGKGVKEMESKSASKNQMHQVKTVDDDFLVIQQDQDGHERENKEEELEEIKDDLIRPSDEVQYQELIMDEREQSSMQSSIRKNSRGQNDFHGSPQFSPDLFSATEDLGRRQLQHLQIDESGFKVHEEGTKGANQMEDRLINIENQNAGDKGQRVI